MKRITTYFLFAATILAHAADSGDQGTKVAQLVRQADSAVIEFYAERKTQSVRFTDAAWIERLAVAVKDGAYEPRSHCFCISYPIISLVRGNDILLTLSVHHGEKLRMKEAGRGMSDFFVGADVGARVTALALEQKMANKAPEPTSGTVTPPAEPGVAPVPPVAHL